MLRNATIVPGQDIKLEKDSSPKQILVHFADVVAGICEGLHTVQQHMHITRGLSKKLEWGQRLACWFYTNLVEEGRDSEGAMSLKDDCGHRPQ